MPPQGRATVAVGSGRIGDRPIQGARSISNDPFVMQGSHTSVPAVAMTRVDPPTVSRSFQQDILADVKFACPILMILAMQRG